VEIIGVVGEPGAVFADHTDDAPVPVPDVADPKSPVLLASAGAEPRERLIK